MLDCHVTNLSKVCKSETVKSFPSQNRMHLWISSYLSICKQGLKNHVPMGTYIFIGAPKKGFCHKRTCPDGFKWPRPLHIPTSLHVLTTVRLTGLAILPLLPAKFTLYLAVITIIHPRSAAKSLSMTKQKISMKLKIAQWSWALFEFTISNFDYH